jgi:ankyrin repeat protein
MLTNPRRTRRTTKDPTYPIHVAAWFDSSLVVVKLLLERCPDCATLRDGKGRTFLHVAAEMKNHSAAVVEYVCREMPQRSSSMILNAQDSNGDTALHCAVRAGNLAVFNCLFRNRQVRLDVANKDGITPLDLSFMDYAP